VFDPGLFVCFRFPLLSGCLFFLFPAPNVRWLHRGPRRKCHPTSGWWRPVLSLFCFIYFLFPGEVTMLFVIKIR
jgi:hypothetical protein